MRPQLATIERSCRRSVTEHLQHQEVFREDFFLVTSSYALVGQVTNWPSKSEMALLLTSHGLAVSVGQYSIRVVDCERVSSALAFAKIRHRFAIYDANDVMVAYLHFAWLHEENAQCEAALFNYLTVTMHLSQKHNQRPSPPVHKQSPLNTMSHFQNHAPWDRIGLIAGDPIRAIGWLSKEQSYETGAVTEQFYRHLKMLLENPWQPIVFMGYHECELCQFDGMKGGNNLFIPASGFLFVVPELILHYITAHHYCPPQDFQDAVLKCTSTRSMEYKRAFLQNGGRVLVAPRDTISGSDASDEPPGA